MSRRTLREEIWTVPNKNIRLKLSFANPNSTGSFCDHKKWFEHCVNKFNSKCSNSTTNQKEIEIITINAAEIVIDLKSEQDLAKAPGRALSGFSKILITDDQSSMFDPYYYNNIFHGKVFTTQSNWTDSDNKLSDADVVKALIDYIAAPKSKMPKGIIQAFDQIRKIVEVNGFVSGDK